MPASKVTPRYIADHIRRVLKDGGSAPHSAEVQWFFKEQVRSRGWYTAELRKVAHRFRRSIMTERGLLFLVQVADGLFTGRVLEEKVFGVFLLEGLTGQLGRREFKLLASWLDRVSSWADHDGLVHSLLSPMVCADAKYCPEVFRWTKSKNRWRRRAACVALIRGARVKKLFPEIVRTSQTLLSDEDDMVQKGLGWLLREAAKYDARKTVPYLMKIRERAPRLVLRTACETLPAETKKKILARN
ncbi:MAG TPA: DNA alkylation repair protein [Terriglobales bacterium]|nr:DNA alkylation repair protein [Terriglobales bacterium]